MKPTTHLIKSCLKGKQKAQSELYRLCFPYLMSIAVRYHHNQEDAVNVLNLAFYKIITKLKQFNIENSFKAWCRTILVNTIISEFRKNQTYIKSMSPTDFEMEQGNLANWEFDEINETIDAEHLRTKMEELVEPEKTILNLFVIDGYSHKEIAIMLSIPEGTSKWHLSNARKNLKQKLTTAIHHNTAITL